MKKNNKKQENPNDWNEEMRRCLEESKRSIEASQKHCEYVRQAIDRLDEKLGIPKGTAPEDYGYYLRLAVKAREEAAAKKRAEHVAYWRERLHQTIQYVKETGYIVPKSLYVEISYGEN